MATNKFQNKYRIPSARAGWHDYNEGDYFITICTAGHEHYFGKIVNSKMQLNELGQFMEDNIINLQSHYLYAAINSHQVMPNHIHLIVCIDTNGVNVPDVLDVPFVETGRAPLVSAKII